jgi:outer membrane beta-barrel protein
VKSTYVSRHILAAALFALALPIGSTAWAQDEPAAETDVDPTADPTAETADEEGLDLDPNDPLYWAKLRDVYTFQRKDVLKQGRLAMTAYAGLIPNNIFEQYVPFGLRLNYYILENIGIELAGSYNLNIDTGLRDTISEPAGVGAQQVLIGDTQVSHTNFGIVWSPFYGKTSWYDSAVQYFDIYLFAGAGVVVAQTVPDFNAPADTEIKPEGAVGAGMAFYLGNHAHLRLDFRQFIFEKVSGGVANPSEVSLGFGWLL